MRSRVLKGVVLGLYTIGLAMSVAALCVCATEMARHGCCDSSVGFEAVSCCPAATAPATNVSAASAQASPTESAPFALAAPMHQTAIQTLAAPALVPPLRPTVAPPVLRV
jgi:hypothetical protein